MEHELLRERLEHAVLSRDCGSDASHDIFHLRRVAAAASGMGREDGGDPDVILAAAYLHDLVNLPKNAPNRHQASLLSADAALPILTDLGFSLAQIEAIQHAIAAHSFSAGIEPRTLEARIVQDADRLDALGALGLARTFYIAGKLGSRLFDGEDPFAASRPLDDKTYAVDHFAVKLLRLEAEMNTDAGRRLAKKRGDILRRFLADLGEEVGHACEWVGAPA